LGETADAEERKMKDDPKSRRRRKTTTKIETVLLKIKEGNSFHFG
jgi:hypothetical protein